MTMQQTVSSENVLSLLDRVVQKTEFGQIQLMPMTAKDRIAELKTLRFKLNSETEDQCLQFIQLGGLQALASILMADEEGVNIQVKEEAVWIITNLALFSQYYEDEFAFALEALMKVIGSTSYDKYPNLRILQ
jgi:hypothetical protein